MSCHLFFCFSFVGISVHSLSAFTHFTLLKVASSSHGIERYQAFELFYLSVYPLITLDV